MGKELDVVSAQYCVTSNFLLYHYVFSLCRVQGVNSITPIKVLYVKLQTINVFTDQLEFDNCLELFISMSVCS